MFGKEIGQPSPEIVEYDKGGPGACPKCGYHPGMMLWDAYGAFQTSYVRYSPGFEDCDCSEGVTADPHLEYRCTMCRYIRPMKTKDWTEPPPPPPKIQWSFTDNGGLPPPPPPDE